MFVIVFLWSPLFFFISLLSRIVFHLLFFFPVSGTNKDKVYENEYVQAMIAIGKILGPYDYDQQFPAFGFGAKVKGSNEVSHCFPLNGDEEK